MLPCSLDSQDRRQMEAPRRSEAFASTAGGLKLGMVVVVVVLQMGRSGKGMKDGAMGDE